MICFIFAVPPLLFYLIVSSTYPWMISTFSDITHTKLAISPYARLTETIIISVIYFITLAISRRIIFSAALALSMFIFFVTVCLTKIYYLYAPLLPADFSQITELYQSKHIFTQIIPAFILILALLFTVNFGLYKKAKPLPIQKFWQIRLLSIALLCFVIYFNTEALQQHLRKNGVFYKKNSNLVVHFLTKGMATSFFQIALFHDQYPKPANYNQDRIKKIVETYELNEKSSHTDAVNVIFLMIESLTNPEYFGWQTTEPATPTLSALANTNHEGTVLSPVYGGKSINAEFELLSGLSMQFAAAESLVYREAIKQPVPSIASYLSQHNYYTMAMRDEPIDTYGFRKIYQWLGFENQLSFTTTNLPKDPTGKYKSSTAIADEIIDVVENNHPAFVFTFTMSSHAPWNAKEYNSQLDFIYPNQTSQAEKNRMKGYLNAINHMDSGIKRLIDHFNSSDQKTLILILGDHQPHLNSYNQFLAPGHDDEDSNTIYKKHQLPFYIWKNYDEQKPVEPLETSMNLLPGLVLKLIGSKPCGIMKFNQILHNNYSLFSKVAKKNTSASADEQATILSDLELIQYDLLYGNNYLGAMLSNNCHTSVQ